MKYVITGGAGNISLPLSEKLLSAGHEVTVISRNAANIAALTAKGAKAAIGSVEDAAFLTKAFAGADAVYTMVPPNMTPADWKGFIGQVGINYAQAIKANDIKHVVNLSSIGAHMADGCGPVSGLYRAEAALNTLDEVNIRHLRPGYFFPNLFANVGMIKNLGIMGSNYGGPESKIIISNPEDIAEVAAQELLALDFTGHSIRYLSSDERTTDDISKVIGTAIGKPELKWIVFSDEDALKGATGAGLPVEIAKNYVEMGHAIRTGEMFSDYPAHRPQQLGKTKLEDFAKIFAAVYNGKETVAAH